MLIVIVIIGILAAAIFPKLWGAQARARDVSRKANLQQVATALVTHQIDKWYYIKDPGNLEFHKIPLQQAGLDVIPIDPNPDRNIDGIAWIDMTNGQYGYCPLKKFGIDNAAFVLMAGSETEGGSNRSYGDTKIGIAEAELNEFDEIALCTEFTEVYDTTATACEYYKKVDQLRYLYRY